MTIDSWIAPRVLHLVWARLSWLSLARAGRRRRAIRVLGARRGHGLTVELIDGTAKRRIGLQGVTAESIDSAAQDALRAVRGLVPEKGYVLSAPLAFEKHLETAVY